MAHDTTLHNGQGQTETPEGNLNRGESTAENALLPDDIRTSVASSIATSSQRTCSLTQTTEST